MGHFSSGVFQLDFVVCSERLSQSCVASIVACVTSAQVCCANRYQLLNGFKVVID